MVQSIEGLKHACAADQSLAQQLKASAATGMFNTPDDWQDWRHVIDGIPVYWWSAAMADVVQQASLSYPLGAEEVLSVASVREALTRGETPPPPGYWPRIPRAFCVFERPTLFVRLRGQPVGLSMLLWAVGVGLKAQTFLVRLQGFTWRSAFVECVFTAIGGLTEPFSCSRLGLLPGDEDTFPQERLALARWACTASMFLEQDVLAETATHVGGQVGKRFRRAHQHDPICRVVTLRRAAQEQALGAPAAHQVAWACRWVVRGHWRRQYFPSRATHVPVWILPHIKGPEDKPFRTSVPTVLAVRR